MENNPEKQENMEPKAIPGQDPKGRPVVEIEIVRHRAVFNLLSDSRSLWRLMITLFMLIVVIFLGLAFVVFSIKKIYPYNTIETNLYGATTLESEDKDVTYWLFNTAELWANSGIKVEAGDLITVRTSGAWHTAIHHLVAAADKNTTPQDFWGTSEGEETNQENKRGEFRSHFRLSPGNAAGILLMNIIPEESSKLSTVLQPNRKNDGFLDYIQDVNQNKLSTYVIGKERTNLRVRATGTLHFAVNDIMLTKPTIKTIYKEFVRQLISNGLIEGKFEDYQKLIDDKSFTFSQEDIAHIGHLTHKIPSFTDSEYVDKDFYMGSYPGREEKWGCLDNELVYYYRNNFMDAWYVDNIGSILIVVERKRK